MSQEEIEALMNGLDIEDDVEAEDETVAVNTQEIEELLSQTEGLKEDIKFDNEKIEENEVEFKPSTTSVSSSDIEKLLSEIENASENTSSPIEEVMIEPEKFDEPEKVIVATEKKSDKKPDRSEDEIVNDWTNTKIKEGIFPFPAEKDTKVVNQLSQVANDSEEKVSQIFDVLSLTLDNNNELRNYVKDFEAYFSTQSSLLSTLNSKFPNIKVFNEHLSNTNKVAESLKSIKNLINSEDSEIFQAMELMQFNDINRQKIERVMSVIRKLSLYLNNLFEDDGATKDVAIAKHIHGDSTDDLIGDDLDKLIAEFSHDK
jgi:hypothetical protein